jgi:hypothetical protein
MMSDDDQELIPPQRKGLPATRDERPAALARYENVVRGTGAAASMITGFLAKTRARAYRDIADSIRAQTEIVDAHTGLRASTMKLLSTTGELEDYDKTLAIEQAERQGDRLARYEKLDADRDRRNYERDEGEHQRELAERRRQREIEDAEAEIVEARRKKFTAEQGFENQQRLKNRNLKIFATRAEAEHLNAEVKAAKVRRELGGGEPKKQNARDAIRAKAEESLIEALADGNDEEADRWQRVLDALGEGEE